MPRCAAAGRATSATLTSQRGPALYVLSGAGQDLAIKLREVGLSTYADEFGANNLGLFAMYNQSLGTPTNVTAYCEDDPSYTPKVSCASEWTSGGTPPAAPIRQAAMANRLGSSIVWQFGDNGPQIRQAQSSVGKAGFFILNPLLTVQRGVDFWFVWDE